MTKQITSEIELVRGPLEVLDTRNPNQVWENTAYAWSVTLRIDDRHMVVEFFTGAGRPNEPETHEVVQCVAMDTRGIDDDSCFEDWSEEHGYDTDSRAAEKIYQKIVGLAEKFKTFIGQDFDIHDLCDEDTCEDHCS